MTAADLVGRWLLDADGALARRTAHAGGAPWRDLYYLDGVVEARQDATVVIHPLTDAPHVCRWTAQGRAGAPPPGLPARGLPQPRAAGAART